jgi:hypothetical protein
MGQDYDAFGNPIGEQSSSGLGTPSSATATPTPAASPRPSTAWPTATPPAPRKRRSGPNPFGVIFLLLRFAIPAAIIVGLGVVLASTVTDETSKIKHSLTPTVVVPDTSSPSSSESSDSGTAKPPAPPHGLSHNSLLRPVALHKAVVRATVASHGRLRMLRVAPDRIDAQFSKRNGGLDIVQVRYDAQAPTVVRTPSGGLAGPTPISTARIDYGAPARLTRSAAKRLGGKVGGVDYLVLINTAGTPGWSVYFKNGHAFVGDAHGRITNRIS